MTPHTQQRTTLPVCPECGSATFWNTTDGIQTLFCISDDCKWKQQICSHPHTPAAHTPFLATFDFEKFDNNVQKWMEAHDATIRNQTLDDAVSKIRSLKPIKGMRLKTFKQIVIESLRTPSTEARNPGTKGDEQR